MLIPAITDLLIFRPERTVRLPACHKNLTQQLPQRACRFWHSTSRWPRPAHSPCWDGGPGPHPVSGASVTECIFPSSLAIFSQPLQLTTDVPAARWRDPGPQTIPTDNTWVCRKAHHTARYGKTVPVTDHFWRNYLHWLFDLSQH